MASGINSKIKETLDFINNRTLEMMLEGATKPVNRYNEIMKEYFDDENFKNAITGVAGNFLLNCSKVTTTITPYMADAGAASLTAGSTALATTSSTALATTSSTALATTGATTGVAGGGAAAAGAIGGGSAVAAVGLPAVCDAIGGLMLGKSIGNFVIDNFVKPKEGKKLLEELNTYKDKAKTYCEDFEKNLRNAAKQLNLAYSNLQESYKKLQKQQYKTLNSNLNRIERRLNELNYLNTTINNTINVIVVVYQNLKQLG